MSNLKRLGRIVKSWSGKIRRDTYYAPDDAMMILTELGMQMHPETLSHLVDNDTIKEEFLNGIYAAEEDAGRSIIINSSSIDPEYDPKVYEEGKSVAFTVTIRGKEKVFAEFPLPFEVYNSRQIEIEAESDEPKPFEETDESGEGEFRSLDIE